MITNTVDFRGRDQRVETYRCKENGLALALQIPLHFSIVSGSFLTHPFILLCFVHWLLRSKMSLPASCEYLRVAVRSPRGEKENKNIHWKTCPSFTLFTLTCFITSTRISFQVWCI